eukprot:6187191-Pleurochrysis_carterae.AAC.2
MRGNRRPRARLRKAHQRAAWRELLSPHAAFTMREPHECRPERYHVSEKIGAAHRRDASRPGRHAWDRDRTSTGLADGISEGTKSWCRSLSYTND